VHDGNEPVTRGRPSPSSVQRSIGSGLGSQLRPTPDRLGIAERSPNSSCGAGALSINDRENYAVLMRVAMLSALNGADTTMNLGFRCVREVR